MPRKYHQGVYEIKNWEKYKGTKCPRFLSSYEEHTYSWADRTPAVLEWSVETIVVPYYNPIKQRKARYIVDLWLKYKDKNGNIRIDLIEIKPSSQVQKVKRGKKQKHVYEEEMMTWAVNQAKWQAAAAYAEERGWTFRLLTEKSIFR